MSSDIWSVLGILPTEDLSVIRRAYSALLKITNPEDDPEGFARLRHAYEGARERSSNTGRDGVILSDLEEPIFTELKDRAGSNTTTAEIRSRLDEFDAMLGSERPLGADDAIELLSQIKELGETGDLIEFASLEGRIARALLGGAPRTNALVRPALDLFDWRWERLGKMSPEAEAVLRRDDDLRFWKPYGSPRHPDHGLYLALTRKLSPRRRRVEALLRPRLAGGVRRLLNLVEYAHPSLIVDLDPQAQTWWREFLGRPRLQGWAIWLAAAVSATAAFSVRAWSPDTSATFSAGVFVAAMCGWAALLWLWFPLVSERRRSWLAERRWRARAWERLGWAPASAILVLLASLVPQGLGAFLCVACGAVPVAWWAFICAEPDTRPSKVHWLRRTVGVRAPLAMWWLAAIYWQPELRSAQMTLAVLTAVVVNAAGAGAEISWFHGEISARTRRTLLLGFGVLLTSTGAAVANCYNGVAPLAPTAAAVVLTSLASLPIVAWNTQMDFGRVYIASSIGVPVAYALAMGVGGPPLVWAAAWLLGRAGLSVALSLKRTFFIPHRKMEGKV